MDLYLWSVEVPFFVPLNMLYKLSLNIVLFSCLSSYSHALLCWGHTMLTHWNFDQNNIRVYCPSLTDGSLGDMLFCHAVRNPGLIIDIVQGIWFTALSLPSLLWLTLNSKSLQISGSWMGKPSMQRQGRRIIVLGGGLPKHHICNANMFRNGADYAVYINTAQEFDGSDSGAQPDEAVSWGKIKGSAKPVKV